MRALEASRCNEFASWLKLHFHIVYSFPTNPSHLFEITILISKNAYLFPLLVAHDLDAVLELGEALVSEPLLLLQGLEGLRKAAEL